MKTVYSYHTLPATRRVKVSLTLEVKQEGIWMHKWSPREWCNVMENSDLLGSPIAELAILIVTSQLTLICVVACNLGGKHA